MSLTKLLQHVFTILCFTMMVYNCKAQSDLIEIDKIEFHFLDNCRWGDILVARNSSFNVSQDDKNTLELKYSNTFTTGGMFVDIYRPKILLPHVKKKSSAILNIEAKMTGGGKMKCVIKSINESEQIISEKTHELKSSEHWKLNTIRIPLDQNVKTITYHITYHGHENPLQKVSIKSPVLLIRKNSITPAPTNNIDKNKIIPIYESELLYAKPISPLINSTIIGLGEPTHGSKTVKKIRYDVTKELIEHQNAKIIAMECPTDLALIFDSYAQGYSDESSLEIIKQNTSFGMEDGDMLVSFLNWVRDLNTSRTIHRRVHIVGIDSPTYYIDTNIFENCIYLYQKGYITKNDFALIKTGQFSVFNNERLKDDRIYSTYFDQNLRFLQERKNNYNRSQRDSLMTVKTLELQKNLAANEKIVIMAHSEHLSRINYDKQRNLGHYLATELGHKYHSITIQFGIGTYLQDSCFIAGDILVDTLPPAPANSFENLALRSGYDLFYSLTEDLPEFDSYASIPRYHLGKPAFNYMSKKRFDAFVFAKESNHFHQEMKNKYETIQKKWMDKKSKIKFF
ncbi:erythromycin esterase family protein [Sphingobacterium faecale]|uniref:Erythromycin esterase family protein n=1 Tax=Sphingobacterium faecale TaxID=2803775 RepID=A0ABS1R1C7_9SPHI|nr:erythromycin esterase family protein [Sphingobacterium faecale]MBL1408054.1 erythromycin esterase family protein [Sphingobacterium faecale]